MRTPSTNHCFVAPTDGKTPFKCWKRISSRVIDFRARLNAASVRFETGQKRIKTFKTAALGLSTCSHGTKAEYIPVLLVPLE